MVITAHQNLIISAGNCYEPAIFKQLLIIESTLYILQITATVIALIITAKPVSHLRGVGFSAKLARQNRKGNIPPAKSAGKLTCVS